MREAEYYRSITLTAARRERAVRVWAAALAVTTVWTIAILAAPLAHAAGSAGLSSPLYQFFGYICHQMPERSLHIAGEQFGVCSRCFGIYLGLAAGVAVYPLWRGVDTVETIPRFWLFLSLVPMAVDWLLTAFGIWQNTQLSRLVTGLILGSACATFIVPALVEFTRSRSYRDPST